ncbi:MAG TPA: succinate dehydrogenase flavoprotein subunit, partial [Blastocatellia bacterium]|nr:succinate dehydrogenase flavoprotein subunit [Blastocatellia bacterium]
MPERKVKIIVVGGGLAGLMATLKAVESGAVVELFSVVPVRRSHSVCAQGGINAAVNTVAEGDSPWIHFDETIFGGDFLADQPPVKAMCELAPNIIYMFDRMGVPFTRTAEGRISFRRLGGTRYSRTAFAGASTGQQLLYALDEQVRRHESGGLVAKFEGWEFLSGIVDVNGVCHGITAMNLRSLEVNAFSADAVVLASGGIGAIFGKSTNSMICTGSAQSALYQQGALYANGEFIQVHPTTIPGDDKLRLMSESIRGEGGRVWVPRAEQDQRDPKSIPERERLYFLEEKYPGYGNLVPRDIASREIFKICLDGHGIGGGNMVYLDLTHIPAETLNRKLGSVLDIYEKFVGDDPRTTPMKIFPGMHYTMGGLWVDYDQMTNIEGLFAAGECDSTIHGANRLGANSLASCIYGGTVAGEMAVRYAQYEARTEMDANLAEEEVLRQIEINEALKKQRGPENAYALHEEMGRWMTDNLTVIRYNRRIEQTDAKLLEMLERFAKVDINETVYWASQALPHARQLYNMLHLARVIARGALQRNESRGAHYKPNYPERDDEQFLKTTLASYTPEGPEISYTAVDLSLVQPRP